MLQEIILNISGWHLILLEERYNEVVSRILSQKVNRLDITVQVHRWDFEALLRQYNIRSILHASISQYWWGNLPWNARDFAVSTYFGRNAANRVYSFTVSDYRRGGNELPDLCSSDDPQGKRTWLAESGHSFLRFRESLYILLKVNRHGEYERKAQRRSNLWRILITGWATRALTVNLIVWGGAARVNCA